jgi:hypothetical protein
MQTRLTDRCPGSHLSSFATKAATNAAPSNRALALPFSSVRALEQFHARAAFHGLFYVVRNFCCKTAQSVSLMMIAPVPANTSANVPINSAPHFFIGISALKV